MTHEARCPECGAPLPVGSPEGHCPKCLLKRGLEANTLASAAGPSSPSAGWTPPAPEELAARFPELEILELIGRGGMGAVYKARQTKLNRVAALKILPPEIGHAPTFADRFAGEAQAMALLSHPHIVAIYDFGERQGLYFFLMEYVDGLNLRQLMSSGNVSPKVALAIVPQICDALQFAHDQGIVHRDIKPENVLMDRRGQVKIADFGLAKLTGQSASGATGGLSASAATEKVMGTPQYMAPEQVEHPKDVDHRADIYSLGVVFYQMLTGELPLGRFEPPSHKVLIDVRLDEVVLKALEHEPERRYQQASQVRTEVETILTTPPVGASADAAAAGPPGGGPAAGAPVPAVKRGGWATPLWTFALHAVLVLLFAVALTYYTPRVMVAFAEAGSPIPPLTALAIGLAKAVAHYWVVLIPMVLAFDLAACLLAQRLGGRRLCLGWGAGVVVVLAVALAFLVLAMQAAFSPPAAPPTVADLEARDQVLISGDVMQPGPYALRQEGGRPLTLLGLLARAGYPADKNRPGGPPPVSLIRKTGEHLSQITAVNPMDIYEDQVPDVQLKAGDRIQVGPFPSPEAANKTAGVTPSGLAVTTETLSGWHTIVDVPPTGTDAAGSGALAIAPPGKRPPGPIADDLRPGPETGKEQVCTFQDGVNRPGTYVLPHDNTTLLELVAQAGGLKGKPVAGFLRRSVSNEEVDRLLNLMTPKGEVGPTMPPGRVAWDNLPEPLQARLSAAGFQPNGIGPLLRFIFIDPQALAPGDPRQNIVLRDGDEVFLSDSAEGANVISPLYPKVCQVLGEVKKPNTYALGNPPATLTQAIEAAGGLTVDADRAHIVVSHFNILTGPTGRDVVDLDRVLRKESPHVVLENNDVIVVPRKAAAAPSVPPKPVSAAAPAAAPGDVDPNFVEAITAIVRRAMEPYGHTGYGMQKEDFLVLREGESPRACTVRGIVRDAEEDAARGVVLYLVATDPKARPSACTADVAANQPFTLTCVPPGDYFVVAIREPGLHGQFGRVGVPVPWKIVSAKAKTPVEGVNVRMSEWLGVQVRRDFSPGAGLANLTADDIEKMALGPCGRVTDAQGRPVYGARVDIGQFVAGAATSASPLPLMAPHMTTSLDGFYGLRPTFYPYTVGTNVCVPLADALGFRCQTLSREKVFKEKEKQRVDFKFPEWPGLGKAGGTIAGRVTDKQGRPVPRFIVRVLDAKPHPETKADSDSWFSTWSIVMSAEDGKVMVGDVPAGECTALINLSSTTVMAKPTMKVLKVVAGEECRFEVQVDAPAPAARAAGIPGDIYIMGDVDRPGVYSTTGRELTLLKMLAAAGFRPENKGKTATVIRKVAPDHDERQEFDIDPIVAGKVADPGLQADDMIMVRPRLTAEQQRQLDDLKAEQQRLTKEVEDQLGKGLTAKHPAVKAGQERLWAIQSQIADLGMWGGSPTPAAPAAHEVPDVLISGVADIVRRAMYPATHGWWQDPNGEAVWLEAGRSPQACTVRGIVRDGEVGAHDAVGLYFVSVDPKARPAVCAVNVKPNEPFSLDFLPPGDYFVVAVKNAGDEGRFGKVGIPGPWMVVRAKAGAPVSGVDIRLSEQLGADVRREFGANRGLVDVSAADIDTMPLGPCGRVTDADGRPVAGALVGVREFNPEARSIAAQDTITNHDGFYGMRPERFPYYVSASFHWPLVDALGCRWLTLCRMKVLEGKQRVDFKFPAWPGLGKAGGTVVGRVTDRQGRPVPGLVAVVCKGKDRPKIEEASDDWYTDWSIRMAVDGNQFVARDVPAGECAVYFNLAGRMLAKSILVVEAGEECRFEVQVDVAAAGAAATEKGAGTETAPERPAAAPKTP